MNVRGIHLKSMRGKSDVIKKPKAEVWWGVRYL
jgi:hypothetical protein